MYREFSLLSLILLVNFVMIYCTVSSGAQIVLLQSALLSLQARSLAAFLALAERKKNTLRGAHRRPPLPVRCAPCLIAARIHGYHVNLTLR
jgi:hypothetical protein